MQFFHRVSTPTAHLGVLPGTFNPVTVAHLALARAALRNVDQVVFVLPRVFPHKEYSGVSFDDRIAILRAAIVEAGPFSVAASEGGLFLDIARECRQVYGPAVRLSFLCGRDAAERIMNWEYPDRDACVTMLQEFGLLVAARRGEYQAPSAFAHAIDRLEMDPAWDCISATEVRRRIASGEPWEHLVPEPAHEMVRRAYRKRL